ncbi:hypothetical protein QO206_14015 [Leeuwenhoekiella aequorea]
MVIKPGPKRIADSTGKPDRRQRDNETTRQQKYLGKYAIPKTA